MDKEKAFETIEKISKKHFAKECESCFTTPGGKARFYDMFCLKGLTEEEYRELGEALLSITFH